MKSPRMGIATKRGICARLWFVPVFVKFFACLLLALLGSQCQPAGSIHQGVSYRGHSAYRPASVPGSRPMPKSETVSSASLWREVGLIRDFVPRGRHGRRVVRPMTPRYITIHSTQNFSRAADARQHALALKRGALRSPRRRGGNRTGYLIWHYTVDESVAVQHMPTYEQGEHADFDGPGNRYSIGLEMCENRGNSRRATVDRTAKLCALLMHQHAIPLGNIVPHYHWPRRGKDPAHKDCPHFLLNRGRPGKTWLKFLGLVKYYHQRIEPKPTPQA